MLMTAGTDRTKKKLHSRELNPKSTHQLLSHFMPRNTEHFKLELAQDYLLRLAKLLHSTFIAGSRLSRFPTQTPAPCAIFILPDCPCFGNRVGNENPDVDWEKIGVGGAPASTPPLCAERCQALSSRLR